MNVNEWLDKLNTIRDSLYDRGVTFKELPGEGPFTRAFYVGGYVLHVNSLADMALFKDGQLVQVLQNAEDMFAFM